MYNTFIQDPIQIEYVNKKLSNHNLLLGSAGTGKTSIALAKLHKLVTEGFGGDTLFVSYTKTLINSCSQDSFREDGQASHLFPISVTFSTFHKLFYDVFFRIYGRRPQILSYPQTLIKNAISNQKMYDNNNIYGKDIEVFVDEIKYIQDFNITTLEEYEQAARIGCKVRIIRREDRKYYWAVYEEYKYLMKQKYDCDFNGAAAVFQEIIRKFYPSGLYDTIIIDEGQDLSPADVKTVVMLLRENGTLLYIGDATQQIYGSRMSWKSLGLNIRNRVTRLENNYRNTVEIGSFAIDLLNRPYWDKNTSDVMYPQNMQTHGIKPILMEFNDISGKLYIFKRFLKQYPQETTCIVTYLNDNVYQIINSLKKEGILALNAKDYRADSDIHVFVCTYHSVKGLEFDNVILWDFDKNFINNIRKINGEDDEMRYGQAMRLFYVACTRARRRLIIAYTNVLSELFPAQSSHYQKIDPLDLLSVCATTGTMICNDNSTTATNIAKAMASSRILNKEEMLDYFQRALREAKEELDIQSPWITERVVDTIFIDKLERLLINNVKIKILYGIQDDPQLQDKNKRTDDMVNHLRSALKKYSNFKICRGNSHAKKLICDDSYCISGSLNWLSYTGQGERQEEGVLLTDKNSIRAARQQDFSF